MITGSRWFMLRPAFVLLLAVALQGAYAQVEPHGPPASVLSPTSPGTAHSTPSSVNSPTPVNPRGRVFVNQGRRRVVFGAAHPRRVRRAFVPVPIFVPAYPVTSDYVDADAAAAQDAPEDSREDASPDVEALREAYNRGAHDALAQQRGNHYGEHYLDAREQNSSKTSASKSKTAQEADTTDAATDNRNSDSNPPGEADNGPATVFVFKDGHKIETKNYAISGQTLFDFSDNAMRKISLSDLDLNATKKANDDLGITVKLPPSTP